MSSKCSTSGGEPTIGGRIEARARPEARLLADLVVVQKRVLPRVDARVLGVIFGLEERVRFAELFGPVGHVVPERINSHGSFPDLARLHQMSAERPCQHTA